MCGTNIPLKSLCSDHKIFTLNHVEATAVLTYTLSGILHLFCSQVQALSKH